MCRVTEDRSHLQRFAWLAIAAALATIGLKSGAWWLTGSVGLLSDAAESSVNLVAAVIALITLRIAARPADASHHYGHSKAEFFSAAAEGSMILVAAVFILVSAAERLLHPTPLANVGIGLIISVAASVINGLVAVVLTRAGRRYKSLTLTADGKHLLTDVWTSVGVVLGVGLVALTGIDRLDPIIAILVALNIIWTGWKLLQASANGLMDATLPAADNATIVHVLTGFASDDVAFHGLRTRSSGHQGFAEVHVLVPGAWSVHRGHDLVERIEAALREELPDVAVTAHLEPREDPRSYDDYATEVPVPAMPSTPQPPAPGA